MKTVILTSALVGALLSTTAIAHTVDRYGTSTDCAGYTYAGTRELRQELHAQERKAEAEWIVRQIEACEVAQRGGLKPKQTMTRHLQNDIEIGYLRHGCK